MGSFFYCETVIQDNNFAGSTVSEYVITTDQMSDAKFYHGFQFIGEFEVSNYPLCLKVNSVSPFGVGSLREAVACAFANDV